MLPISGSADAEEELGLFGTLLADGGIVWQSGGGAMGVEDAGGFICRCHPSKLRIHVERALMHDRVRREGFIEVTSHNVSPFSSHSLNVVPLHTIMSRCP